MKTFSRIFFAAYLLVLVWLVLFKFSYDPSGVLRDFQIRRLNLIPFAYTDKREIAANLLAFFPFGVMLGVNFKRLAFTRKLAVVFSFSFSLELIQYVLAIGITDITDVIMNTLGGFVGLVVYAVSGRLTKDVDLDKWVLIVGVLMMFAILFLRIFVFIVRY